MLEKRQGSALLVTVVGVAIASIWFVLILAITSNYQRITVDHLTLTQSKQLSQGGMNEGIALVEQALEEGRLAALPKQLAQHEAEDTAGVGRISVHWQAKDQRQIRISAEGKVGDCRTRLVGDFAVLSGKWFLRDNQLPTVLWTERDDYNDLLRKNIAQNSIIQNQHFSTIILRQVMHEVGSIHCRSIAQPLTVKVEGTVDGVQQLLIEGDLLLAGTITADEIIVTGNLLVEQGRVHCRRLMVYGDVSGNPLCGAQGIAEIAGTVAESVALVDSGLILGVAPPPVSDVTARLVLTAMRAR